jgi:hypothetical protein
MTFLDKGLVKKMTDLLGTFYCIAHTLEHLSLHRLAYFSHSNKNPFSLWTTRFCFTFQKHIPVSSLTLSAYALLRISWVFAVQLMLFGCICDAAGFSVWHLSVSDGCICCKWCPFCEFLTVGTTNSGTAMHATKWRDSSLKPFNFMEEKVSRHKRSQR